MPLDLGVLISGRGSNLGAILDAIGDGRLDARVRVVLSNRADAPGLARAEAAAVPTCVLVPKAYADRASYDAALVAALRETGASFVVLAGFMRLVTPTFLDAFSGRVLNVHPSLLPSFPGLDAQAQALAYGARITGCTVHLVDAGTDTGPIVAQAAVPVLPNDDHDSLAARVLVREHELLVRTLGWFADGRVEVVPATVAGSRTCVRVRGVDPFFGLAPGAR